MVLGALLAGLAAVLAGTLYAVVQGVELWRQAKRSGRTLTDELARFEERAARTERLLGEAESASLRLAAAQERLRVSRARLAVLTGALESAQRRTRWLRAFLPIR